MPRRKSDLKVENVWNYLSQIGKNMSPDTIIKLKTRAARCLCKVGGKKYLSQGIELYNEAYDLQCEIRGSMHPRSLNLLTLIIESEKRKEKIKIKKSDN